MIARAAQVMRAISAEPAGLTISELMSYTRLPRTTVHRIVITLADQDFVRISADGRAAIGAGLVALVSSSGRDVRRVLAPYLERLSREVRETVDLAVLDDREVLFIDHCTARRALRVVAEVGTRLPLHSTASGKALLAALGPDEAKNLLPRRLVPATPKTVTNRRALLAELEEVRLTGLAYDCEEQTVGIFAVGTALRVGELVAITVVLPVARFAPEEHRIAAAILRTREAIRTDLGIGASC